VDQLPTDSMYHYGYELCSSFADLFIYSNEADLKYRPLQMVLFEQSNRIDWIHFAIYDHWPKYSFSGNSISMDMIEDTMKTIRTTTVSFSRLDN